MKPFMIFLSCWLGVAYTHAQSVGWSNPEAITDSLHNHRNICFPLGWDMSYDSLFVVWEIADDTLSTAIWCKNLKSTGAPFPLLETAGIHYRNPKLYQIPNGDTLFYLYYETDQAGNWDIMYIGYLGNGLISPPVPVCTTPYEERSFSYVAYYGAVWQKNTDINYRRYAIPGGFIAGSQIQMLDQGNCRNPVYSGEVVAWEKPVGDDVQVWASMKESNYQYSLPMKVMDTGLNQNLTLGSGFQGEELLWQIPVDGFWRLKGYLPTLPVPLEVIDFPGANNIQPVYSHMVVGVQSDYPFVPGMLAFASDSSGNYEIYAYECYWGSNYLNLSGYSQDDIHPGLFVVWNYEPDHGNLILTWESNRNGHWQIWMRNMDIYLGSQEMNAGRVGAEVIAVPNPFDFSTMLEFRTDKQGPYQAEIFSQQGTLAWSSSGEIPHPGIQRIAWDGRTNAGASLPAGMYLIRIRSDHQVFQGRVIHQ
ncbi:MAG: T9SS type A sorting domain-containing protein [bacterium]